jgi:hypothetical protein
VVFRFIVAIALVVSVALAGVGLEKRALQLRRDVSVQHFREGILRERHARLRLRTQELGAPARLVDDLERGRIVLETPHKPSTAETTAPLLFLDTAPE